MADSILGSADLASAREEAVARLLAARTPAGHWEGRLSSSPLATATAITALRLVDEDLGSSAHAAAIAAGCRWLALTQRADGTWGDTVESLGNLSTTLLCWGALAAAAPSRKGDGGAEDRAATAIRRHTTDLSAPAIAAALASIYGRDRTFAVPILTHLALCGRFGEPRDPAAWQAVPQLPFQLAALPRSWFRLVDLQVVSYALPALIAIGQVRHALAPEGVLGRGLRSLTREATLARLAEIQPANGGFLEATPLTSFVTMSLAGMGQAAHVVARRGAAFLAAAQRPDGSWPIDTNLATWGTTLSVAALAVGGQLAARLDRPDRGRVARWLLDQQWREEHPATGAAPGGWAWTDLPGGVPDADDTSGAVVAMSALAAAEDEPPAEWLASSAAGLRWLVKLANRDGGIPTFCRGWGRLPFDTSCPDITAHFLRAALAAASGPAARASSGSGEAPRRERLPAGLARGDRATLARACTAAHRYLARVQAADGAWTPLWFGNERHASQANPTYGTAKVVVATLDGRGADWLVRAAGPGGGFGGGPGLPPTIEETAVATEALAAVAAGAGDRDLRHRALAGVEAGVRWLLEHTDGCRRFPAAPIGLYFAKLWYFEDLYPLVFTVAALERAARLADAEGQACRR